jgi:FkbM family methyltransferase
MMSPRYALRLARLLAKHPSALRALPLGGDAVGGRLLDLMAREYLAHPVDNLTIKGFKINLNPSDGYVSGQIAGERTCEADVTPYFEKALRNAGVVVDAGANIGWYTLLSASRVERGGRVISFEPDETNFAYLAKSVSDNAFTNVKLMKAALSDEVGSATLHLSPISSNPGMHSIAFEFATRSITVPTTTLDKAAFDEEIRMIDVLKVDVEGAEPRVLRGGISLLRGGCIRQIFLEWTPECWLNQADLISLLENKYDLWELKWSRQTTVRALSTLRVRANLYLRLRT